jgi:hypothetical protein
MNLTDQTVFLSSNKPTPCRLLVEVPLINARPVSATIFITLAQGLGFDFVSFMLQASLIPSRADSTMTTICFEYLGRYNYWC